ncbi:GPW/gp25 family protein [Pendulispora albinea]|uniref:GPW/gp25 family protein n=1 Tax=Pendulispora albinea TaxID=2741071 RepID=A0ABZ2LPR9_9BACT
MSALRDIARSEPHRRAPQTSQGELRARLLADIDMLFGTVRGSMPGDLGYGVGDVTSIYQSREDAGKAWCLETQQALRRYVPLLRAPRVTYHTTGKLDLVFRVKIEGAIALGGRELPVAFEASIDPRRAWRIG